MVDSPPKGFLLPTTDSGTFGIHPSYIQLVERNLFRGVPGEDPCKHIEFFTEYCSTIPLATGVTQDRVKGVLFSFSLTDVREWLRDLDREASSVTYWNSLALAFYRRYFPPQHTNALRDQIMAFEQLPTNGA
ncbi:uncharacterized protein LOC141589937 [Silene latifolia]|uniref:uncharacterized protein LOC141589937 n=1 Tax=Silene latifolia TaxID=37657 RepID=UPI003D777D26